MEVEEGVAIQQHPEAVVPAPQEAPRPLLGTRRQLSPRHTTSTSPRQPLQLRPPRLSEPLPPVLELVTPAH